MNTQERKELKDAWKKEQDEQRDLLPVYEALREWLDKQPQRNVNGCNIKQALSELLEAANQIAIGEEHDAESRMYEILA